MPREIKQLNTSYPVRVPLQTRFADSDATGHLNNASYLVYFELARAEYFGKVHGALNVKGRGFILGEVYCRFVSQGYFGDKLVIEIGISGVGRSSFRQAYRVVNDKTGTLVAEGWSTTVCFDYAANKSMPLPEEWRRAVAEIEGWDAESLS